MMETGFTKTAINELRQAGASYQILHALAQRVSDYPRDKYDVDTFDGLSCLGVELSWIRNYNNNSALILTRKEALMLDEVTV